MANERHTAAFVVGLALGGLAGAGYVLFKTPRSGTEVRAGITARLQGIVGAVKETAGVVGVETVRAGEQTVERLEATGAAVRERLPGMTGVADLIPGNRSESRTGDAPAPEVRPDTPAGTDELSDAIAGAAASDDGVVAPPVAEEALEAVAEANLTNLPSATLAGSRVPDTDGVEPSRPPGQAINSSG